MSLVDRAIDHRQTVMVLIVLVAFLGVVTYLSIPREAFPEIQIPYIIVNTRCAGVAPADVESSVTLEIEKKLKSLSDVEHITSSSREGSSAIIIEFSPDMDSDKALQRVRDKVAEAKSLLPADADEPTLSEIDVSQFPVLMVNVHGQASLVKLKEIAEALQDRIEGIKGVLSADLSGELTRQIRVLVDRDRLAAYQIPVPRFLALIQSEEKNVTGGLLKGSNFQLSVRVPGEFASPLDIFGLILETRDGKPIYLSDVATVVDTFEDRLSIARFDGKPCVTLAVRKRSGENIIRIAKEVRAIIDAAQPLLPAGVKISTSLDSSKTIRKLVADLENSLATAVIFIVLSLVLFLGFRASLIVAVAIPLSALISIAVIASLGMTLNMIVLFSLILALGMMVDNSIVIVENIYRHREEGLGRIEAAKVATREVFWPVVTSQLTTIAAFAPMLFWPGIMGKVMGYLPRTVIITLVASLVVALLMNPAIAVAWMPRRIRRAGHRGTQHVADPPAAKATSTPFSGTLLVRAYTPIIRGALRVRWLTVLIALAALVGSMAAFGRYNGQVEFFPRTDPNEAAITLKGSPGMRLEATDALARRAEAATEGFDNIQYTVTGVGAGAAGAREMLFGGAGGADHQARVSIDFTDFDTRQTPAVQTIAAIRTRLADLAGAEVKVEEQQMGPPTGTAVNIELSGPDYRVLADWMRRVKAAVATVPGVTNVRDDLEEVKPELRITVDRRRAALLGVNTAAVAATIRASLSGLVVGTYREGEDDYDIVVRLPEESRRRVADLDAVTIASPTGAAIPISAVTRREYVSGLGTIRRKDHARVITVSADSLPGYNNRTVLMAAQAAVAPLVAQLPPGYTVQYTGEREEQQKASDFLAKAGIVALLLIALILVTEFNSLALPFIILISVVCSWIGVFAGLTITGMPFGVIMGGIGVIALAGVVVNNAIVLIDYTEQLRRRGLGTFEAALRAGQTRLRPVLLTAIASIVGLLPMALGWNLDVLRLTFTTRSETAQFWRQMAVVTIFGLAVATALTLVVVPVLYTYFEQVRDRLRDRKTKADVA
jgi:multidrug efflux pump